ncbi:MAG: FAD-binding protein [Betaproteobacteria bacterium]|nr:FAD-binding protein [Betaproteobacteria bacterium]
MTLAPSPASRGTVLAALGAVRPPLSVVAEAECLAAFETDAYIQVRETPLAAVLPESEAEVIALVRALAPIGVPVVTRGAGTGISGGAIPHADGVLAVLTRLRAIVRIDAAARLAVVEPGVPNAQVSEAARPAGLHFAPDPSSQVVSTIGGNIAENAGGVHCLKYGLTVHNVLGVRLVDGEGELLEIGGEALDAPGYDLLALVTGSEGNLGLITRATLRLLPRPESTQTVLAAFDTVKAGAEAVGAIIGAGLVPAALEMMDRVVIDACERYMALGLPKADALLLVEVDGGREEAGEALGQVEALLAAAGATEVRVAKDDDERAKLWKSRKGAFAALASVLPDYYTMDGTIPRRALPEVLEAVYALGREYGLTIGNVFHAGDGNMHPCIFYDATKPGEFERSEELGGKILELCIDHGGTITGEHGVGLEKLKQMCLQFREGEIAAFHDVKRVFDPAGILNPGKAVPTLKRCAEWGGMHVRAGRVPRPDIPRF